MPFPTTPILDAFTRADGPVGSNYTRPVYDDTVVMTVNNEELQMSDLNAGGYWNPASFGPDAEAYLLLTVFSSIPLYLYVRLSSPGAAANGYRARWAAGAVDFFRLDSGVATQIGAGAAATVANNVAIGLSAVGSTLTAYMKKNGVWAPSGGAVDTTYASAGRIAISGGTSAARQDDFGGGTVVPVDASKFYPVLTDGHGLL